MWGGDVIVEYIFFNIQKNKFSSFIWINRTHPNETVRNKERALGQSFAVVKYRKHFFKGNRIHGPLPTAIIHIGTYCSYRVIDVMWYQIQTGYVNLIKPVQTVLLSWDFLIKSKSRWGHGPRNALTKIS